MLTDRKVQMNDVSDPISRGDLDSALMKSFIEGVSWPVDGGSLAAMLDMGLSVEQVADYFSVEPAEVSRLCEQQLTRHRR